MLFFFNGRKYITRFLLINFGQERKVRPFETIKYIKLLINYLLKIIKEKKTIWKP